MSTFRTLGIEEISHRISGADALIVCHTSPDGDTVGSAFALAEIIRLTGGDARVVCSETFPDRFSFMTRGESGEYRDGEENGKTLICVDVASPAQLGRLTHLAAKVDIMIDHHGTGEIFSDGLVDPDAAAAGIIVYDIYKFMRESGAVPESAYTARMLYAAVSSDTGSFRYANTDARAHLCAAYLVGIINSGYHIHERGFAASVLAEKRQYLALVKCEIDVFVRDDTAEALGNVFKFQRCCFTHCFSSGIVLSWFI